MANPYIGQVTAFAFPYAPRGWGFCDGSAVPINQFGALFALVGFTFGGDGKTTVGLPNLGGASPCGTGTGPGLSTRQLGQSFGSAAVTLNASTLPMHTHNAQAVPFMRGAQPSGTPQATSGLSNAGSSDIYATGGADLVMSASGITPAGGGGAHNNMQPYFAVNYGIALVGLYPSFD